MGHDASQHGANPAPLGLFGFAMTTILLNLHNAGFFPLNTMIMAMGIFFGGIILFSHYGRLSSIARIR